ncbi:MAG: tetratricopeptide repeat protein [Candidatus Latescibacterota bacterium]
MQEIANMVSTEQMVVVSGLLGILAILLLIFIILQFLKNKRLKNESNETDVAAMELLEDVFKDVSSVLDTHSKPKFKSSSEIVSRILNSLCQRKLVSAELFLKLSVVEYLQGYSPQAIRHAESVLELDEASNNPSLKAKALGNIGIMYYEKGDMDRALKNLLDALAVCRENGLKDLEAGNLRHIGQVHKRRNDSEMGLDYAMKYFMDALELDRQLMNRAGLAQDLVQAGSILLDSGNFEGALANYEEALTIHREDENRADEAQDLGNIGLVHQIKGDLDSALRYLKKALEIYESIGSKQGEAQSLGNIGLIHQAREEFDLALEYHSDALEIDRELEDRRGEGQDMGSIGIIHYKKGNLSEALSNLRQARIIFEATGYTEDREMVDSTIREIEAKM